jgi:galactokinase
MGGRPSIQMNGFAPPAARAAGWFGECYGAAPDGVWHAPGRANLIGEHTDYNDGFVLPFALAQGVRAAAARRGDGVLEVCSAQAGGGPVRVRLDGLAPGTVTGWAAYPAGVAWALREAGHRVGGASIAFDSDLAEGAGLSSSAAIECATAVALTGLYGAGVPRPELARLAQHAENDFVGVPCGIMDQSASMLCVRGHALLLDCRSLETSQVPLDLGRVPWTSVDAGGDPGGVRQGGGGAHSGAMGDDDNAAGRRLGADPRRQRSAGHALTAAGLDLLVLDTRVQHELGDSGYTDRRRACERAAALLGVPALRDVTDLATLDRLAGLAADGPVLRRRARHVVTDDQRVQVVAGRLRAGAAAEVGPVLTASHRSLRDDFEVSWPEADVAVDAALAAGALGGRMIGGGFGGSVIAMVPAGGTERVLAAVRAEFGRRGWTEPQVVPAAPSDGAGRLG